MTMTTKLWISNDLELRHSPSGWPQLPGNPDVIWLDQSSIDQFNAALTKAKAESIPVIDNATYIILKRRFKLEPHTFIEVQGEVEVFWQCKVDGLWKDWSRIGTTELETRQVARLKPKDEMTLKEEANLLSSFTESGAMSYTQGHELMRLDGPGVPMIQNEGLKANILEAFRNHWGDTNTTRTVVGMLSEVLDELGIK